MASVVHIRQGLSRISVFACGRALLTVLLTAFSAATAAEPLLPDLFAWESLASPYYMHDGSMDLLTIRNKVLYRFSLPIPNIGAGPLELREVTHPDLTQDVYQRIYDTEGGISEVFLGSFPDADPPYGHLYLKGIAEYHLRTVTSGNGVGPIVASRVKTSYALIDGVQYNTSLPGAPAAPVYDSIYDPLLGISVGWADVYRWFVPGQWIEVTGLPDGQYWLEAVIDPYGLIQETNDANNTTRVLVNLVVPDPMIMPGDYNQDDVVDAADYIVWRKTLGQDVSAGTGADGNGNNQIDAGDYSIWRANFGQTAGSGSLTNGTVPEPATLMMLLVGIIAMFACRPLVLS